MKDNLHIVPRRRADTLSASVEIKDTGHGDGMSRVETSADPKKPMGYKQNKFIIPSDWTISPLREVAPLQRGFDLPESHIRSGPYPVVYSNGVLEHHNHSMVKGPGVVTGRSGTIGKVHFVEGDYWPHNTSLWVTSFCGNDPKFIYYLYIHTNLERLLSGSGVPTLNRNDAHQYTVPLPPISEQRAIAEVLSDVDGMLSALEALIAKKRAIKQAAMQQLLAGETRLPGFSGQWETKRLGDMGLFSKGRGIKRANVSFEGLPCVRYGELYTQYHNYILKAVSRIPPSVALTALPIQAGDLLFAGSGETAEEIGRCAAYLGREQAYAGGDIVVLTPSKQNPTYLSHLMNHPTVVAQKVRMGQGDAVVHISARNLAHVEIELPSLTEQTAIAAVLSDMDAEIATVQRRRDKTRTVKQGMMQQLLTGRVRLLRSE